MEALVKKKAIVTGASGAIGEAIARQIAATGDYQVTLVARSESNLKAAAKRIISETSNADVDWASVDLSRKSEIASFAKSWDTQLDVLVNNAAASPRARQETPEGIELQFAANVLGYYWMMQSFRSKLAKATSSRVVNVASYWAGGLNFQDLEFKNRAYDNDSAYRQSKQADRMLSAGFASLFESDGITVNACHPGDVRSKLSSDLGFGGHQSPDQGADTPVMLAINPRLDGVNGKYFEHQREKKCSFCADRAAVDKLMDICASY